MSESMSLDWTRIGNGLRSGRYNLLLGAGISLDSQSGSPISLHNGNLPSSRQLRDDLSKLLPNIKSESSLHRLYRNMSSDQVRDHITYRFTDCVPGPTANKITEFRWNRIFTLNIDDALENAYRRNSAAMQTPIVVNFMDNFFDAPDRMHVQIIHLHGFSKRHGDGYVFDLKEYAKTISDNNVWGHILGDIIRSEPFFVLGTSLEEPDLAYFVAERDPASERTDRAPSILVEPSPDGGTVTDCKEFALLLYKGSALNFLQVADQNVPNRPSLLDVAHSNLGELATSIADPGTLSLFHSYFESVPAAKQGPTHQAANFALGHEATWSDI